MDLSYYGIKPTNFNNIQQTTAQSIPNLTQGLKQPNALNTIKLNDGTTMIHLGEYQEPVTSMNSVFNQGTYYNNYKQFGFESPEEMSNHIIKLNGQAYLKQEPTFFQKYGTGIQTGLGLAQLGLGIGSFIENRATMKQQRKAMKEQLRETKAEYERINKLRSKLNSEYKGK